MSTINWSQNNKIAVCLYLYHTDLWPEFYELLFPLKQKIRLYIGLCQDQDIKLNFEAFDHQISYHDNYGADVAPFLKQLQHIDEPLFIKLHSKKSFWGFKYHINWRQIILNDLIGSKSILKKNIHTILENKDNAVLCNKNMIFENREFTNSQQISHLCHILSMDYDRVKHSKFMAGNMFMGRTDLFKNILLPHQKNIDDLLTHEKGKVDDKLRGTFSHAMERIFGYIVTYNNLSFCYPKYNFIKILNINAPNKKYFNLIITYNYYCYLNEDINVYGQIIKSDTKTITIKWLHLEYETIQIYRKINSNTIEKYQYAMDIT